MLDEDDALDRAIKLGIRLLNPFIANKPSSCISSAKYDLFEVTITFKDGSSYSYPCNPEQWTEYRAADSPGSAYHKLFHGS